MSTPSIFNIKEELSGVLKEDQFQSLANIIRRMEEDDLPNKNPKDSPDLDSDKSLRSEHLTQLSYQPSAIANHDGRSRKFGSRVQNINYASEEEIFHRNMLNRLKSSHSIEDELTEYHHYVEGEAPIIIHIPTPRTIPNAEPQFAFQSGRSGFSRTNEARVTRPIIWFLILLLILLLVCYCTRWTRGGSICKRLTTYLARLIRESMIMRQFSQMDPYTRGGAEPKGKGACWCCNGGIDTTTRCGNNVNITDENSVYPIPGRRNGKLASPTISTLSKCRYVNCPDPEYEVLNISSEISFFPGRHMFSPSRKNQRAIDSLKEYDRLSQAPWAIKSSNNNDKLEPLNSRLDYNRNNGESGGLSAIQERSSDNVSGNILVTMKEPPEFPRELMESGGSRADNMAGLTPISILGTPELKNISH